MKSAVSYLIFLLIFIFSSDVLAAPVGSPEMLYERGRYAVTVITNHTFDREMEAGNVTDSKIEEADQFYTQFSYGITSYANLFGNVGIGNLTRSAHFISPSGFIREEYDFGIMGGGGGKFAAELHPDSGWWAGLDVQVNWCRMPLGSGEARGERSFDESGKITAHDFHIAFLLSKRIELEDIGGQPTRRVVPYGGVKLSGYTLKGTATFDTASGTTTTTGEEENADSVGLVTGFDLDWGRTFQLRLEGSFLDDESLAVSLSYIF